MIAPGFVPSLCLGFGLRTGASVSASVFFPSSPSCNLSTVCAASGSPAVVVVMEGVCTSSPSLVSMAYGRGSVDLPKLQTR
ncbi:hypothetical protein M758_1G169800 [Ceratodon purpureus]|uniref:Uncharacterized protein n=1 Tax=Ceratodon purpureus TaxID=3225 RepID=A0A8T0J928_CERPU|nr:hypothetical protein KC19_1G173100 [Ceratodon purpureus]KAG0630319.1 hypothetical protein M758_1G169800 [Ceratodon purpureus]